MAFIKCEVCGKQYSDKAPGCPFCKSAKGGKPIQNLALKTSISARIAPVAKTLLNSAGIIKRIFSRSLRVTRSFGPDENDTGDTWEGGFWEASDPKKLYATLQIDYCDAKGDKTRREITVRQFDNELHGGMIIAHCHLRDATRTFRFDRIKTGVDINTGEVVDDVKQYLNDQYDQSPDRLTDLLITDYIDILKVLYYMAKADGKYQSDEKGIIIGYIRQLIRDDRLTEDMVSSAIRGIPVPSPQGFKLALGRILKGGWIDPARLKECCQEIVGTQNTVHPNEKAALDYIDKKYAAFQKESKTVTFLPQSS